jgi:single-stranded-DNA-specific exonuclease
MNKKWVLREKVSDDLEKQLLFYRGIKTEEEAEKFFNPDYERDLRDPFEFSQMQKIVDRIVKAVESNEKIVVFGDYDADGICACVVFHDFFKKIGFDNFQIYIPDRGKEGHGLNLKAVDEFIKQKINLIIAVDCGITDNEKIKKAKKCGIDVIVIDHHLPAEELPLAFAILDPKIEDEDYPFKDFCGAGLAFKVVSALVKNEAFSAKGGSTSGGKIMPGWEKWLLDVTAVATVADMFSLLDESRVLVYFGLEVLKKTRRPGLISLFQKLQIDKLNITEDDIGYLIAPCINVASRFDHATISFSLLTTDLREEAEALSLKLVGINNERKRISEEIFTKMDAELSKIKNLPEIVILGDESWPFGILAILATKILEKYDRPAIVWGRGNEDTGPIRGSCRSNGRINLVELLNEIGDKIFSEYGGHAVSTAFAVKEGKIRKLNKEVEQAYQKIAHYEIGPSCLWLDAELDLEKIDWNFLEFFGRFRPFGTSNPKPIFLLKDLEIFEVRTFGNGGIHLKLNFRKNSGEIISAIGFFMQQKLDFAVEKGMKVDLAASVEKNTFNGYTELRLRIVDIRKAQ